MLCPYCLNQDTRVVDKRDNQGLIKRRRECLKCKKRFNTKEAVEKSGLMVIKKDGKRENFDIEKLKRGVLIACEKRPISSEKINKMLATIEEKIRKRGREIKTVFIGDLVSRELKKLDQVAYVRFASVYKDFKELDDFKKEIKDLMGK